MIGLVIMQAATVAANAPHTGLAAVNEWAPTINLAGIVTIGGACLKAWWTYKKDQDAADEKAQKRVDDKIDKLAGGWENRIGKVENKADSFLPEVKIKAMMIECTDELRHKLANERQRVNALETFRSQDIERIVKLETNMSNIEKSVGRIEHAVEKLGTDMGTRIDGWADKLALSIREVRNVSAK